MPKFLICILVLLWSGFGVNAQKSVEKEYDANHLESLVIDGTSVYEIRMISENRKTISLKATIAGDTADDVMITEKHSQTGLQFGVKYAPYFIPENDKLAAHKVLSIILELKIPEGLDVALTSDIGSLTASGSFKNLRVSLEGGNCFATNLFGNATLMTLNGDIKISVLGPISGTAISKNGTVVNTLSTYYKKHIFAESRNGNITLTQTEN